jgi:ADP-ribosylglycohydrolase
MTKPTVDQYIGCLIGCGIGDAIGAVVEHRPRKTTVKLVQEVVEPKDWDALRDKNARGTAWTFGQYTDDTQLSRELMISIVDNGGFDPESFSGRIADMFDGKKPAIVGGGKATAEAAALLQQGTSWEEAGTPPPRAGNGGAMRAGPIGLLHWNDADACMKDAWDQAWITHQAEMSCAGSVAIAMAVAMSLNASRESSHPGDRGWWDWLARFVEKAGSLDFAEDIRLLALKNFKKQEKASEILQWIMDEDKASGGLTNNQWDGISPWARTSTLWALYAFMRSPKDFWRTLNTALLAGGDTDTIAAMACALSGAYNGAKAFEDHGGIVDLLHDQGKWTADKLTALATSLHTLATTEHPDDAVVPLFAPDAEAAVRDLNEDG